MTNVLQFKDLAAKEAEAIELETAMRGVALKHGGGGGTSGPMEPSMKDYVDARDDAIESRLSAKLDTLATKATIWGAMGTAVALILAAIAFGGDRFDSGMGMADVKVAQDERDMRQDESMRQINEKLDRLIAARQP